MTEETRRAIVAAAERALARRGLERATIKEIAVEAGVASGLIYHYFPGKLELLVATATEGCKALEGTWSDGGTAEERAARGFATLKSRLRADAQVVLCELLVASLHEESIASEVREFVRRDTSRIAEIVEQAAQGRAARQEVAAVAVAIWGGLLGIVHQALIDPDLDAAAAVDALAEMAFGLAGQKGWL
ncbi:MAG: TetR/AcrR family transcriptional regulator [Acidimicrobiales bacterium]